MKVNFDALSKDSRIWIYQADRKLSKSETEEILIKGGDFIEQWTAHGSNLQGAIAIFYDQFLVLGVDENFNEASGCSIDASVHFLKSLEQNLKINFFDRYKVAFKENDSVFIENFSNIKESIKAGKIASEFKTFNNHITSKAEFDDSWITEVGQSWMSKYF